MKKQFSPAHRQAWSTLAQAWVDTEYDERDLARFTEALAATGLSATELDRIAYREVCGAFALYSIAVFTTAGMALPDWYYPEDLAEAKIEVWVSRPYIYSLINPLWHVGYRFSVDMMRSTMGPALAALAKNTKEY